MKKLILIIALMLISSEGWAETKTRIGFNEHRTVFNVDNATCVQVEVNTNVAISCFQTLQR
jgi:hypothetical protein